MTEWHRSNRLRSFPRAWIIVFSWFPRWWVRTIMTTFKAIAVWIRVRGITWVIALVRGWGFSDFLVQKVQGRVTWCCGIWFRVEAGLWCARLLGFRSLARLSAETWSIKSAAIFPPSALTSPNCPSQLLLSRLLSSFPTDRLAAISTYLLPIKYYNLSLNCWLLLI